nr:MAG TPA: hypothetical protein [Crassvirales sp.]
MLILNTYLSMKYLYQVIYVLQVKFLLIFIYRNIIHL